MASANDLISDFVAQKRIAVAGVSRQSNRPANAIYRRLRDFGCDAFATNPNAEQVEGDACHPNLKSVPAELDGVVIVTHPTEAEGVVRECVELGIPRVWIHRSFGQGSVSDAAVDACHANGISVIVGGCPLMYYQPIDIGHRCVRWILKLRNRISS
jgi:predicted CoA-binding protein